MDDRLSKGMALIRAHDPTARMVPNALARVIEVHPHNSRQGYEKEEFLEDAAKELEEIGWEYDQFKQCWRISMEMLKRKL